ncbi:hypothetical protein [Streptomyces eurythermus]|uniref:hypothetical protein n=1 Tax=Streptomyces eurythermus TaxID=42237 RepID=UPI0036FA3AFB
MDQRPVPGRTAGDTPAGAPPRPDTADAHRRVPRTDTLLRDPRPAAAADRLGAHRVKTAVRQARERARAGGSAPEQVPRTALDLLPGTASGLRPVLTATGVLLHTNLGRAPLSDAARQAVNEASGPTLDRPAASRVRHPGRGGRAAPGVSAPGPDELPVMSGWSRSRVSDGSDRMTVRGGGAKAVAP